MVTIVDEPKREDLTEESYNRIVSGLREILDGRVLHVKPHYWVPAHACFIAPSDDGTKI